MITVRKKKKEMVWLDGLTLAFQFLTIIPIKKNVPWDARRARASVLNFPFIGAVLGILLSMQAFLLLEYTAFSTVVIAAWLLCFSIVFSGGLHLDGWMDVSDAIFSYRDQERKLDIMKDSRVGAFGVLSLLFLLGWRYVFILELLNLSTFSFLYFFIIPVLTRCMMGLSLIYGRPARKEGMAHAFKQHLSQRLGTVYFGYLVMLFFVIVTVYSNYYMDMLVMICSALLFLVGFTILVFRQFGGVTGDTVGATVEGGETWLWMTVWLLHYSVMG
ncbi:adenosylcobinamide-GDP ribazoletransferase [Desertibacillus haloalkaliphilus]|uniref:adenosylcobinamide-GDP ribazoletransferase n=1 Tax=Desertibacillus haloalkaliphilus TaxID=1328930 RepID=UPI001C258125|nr:adenosylcobinamide-GDP ribazoletransferase [Desertibacillus haloalkaliphilus]MBU8907187.1 adenosylcobinamide-GDP ribazoletransferase [Desertibacillus haloalkaliphilus]